MCLVLQLRVSLVFCASQVAFRTRCFSKERKRQRAPMNTSACSLVIQVQRLSMVLSLSVLVVLRLGGEGAPKHFQQLCALQVLSPCRVLCDR